MAGAIKYFSEVGYQGTDLQNVADALGIAKGTIYRYFKTKEDLFLAVADHSIDRLTQGIRQAVQSVSGPVEKIKAIIGEYLRFFEKERPLAEIIAQERGQFRQHAEEAYFRVFSENVSHIEEIIREGIATGVFRNVDPKQAAETLGNLLCGTTYTYVVGSKKGTSPLWLGTMMDLVLYGLASERSLS